MALYGGFVSWLIEIVDVGCHTKKPSYMVIFATHFNTRTSLA